MTDELWTIEQLPDQVAALLAHNYDGQSNGRVRELPNGRTIRWYTTIGLVDRPVATRGRTALYGRRHLLQLAAVKQQQAAGRSLAEIQELLVGASDHQLANLAGLPRIDVVSRPGPTVTGDFWKHTTDRPTAELASAADVDTVDNTVSRLVPGIRLGDSVTVVLDAATRVPDADELAAIEAAAAPLLDVLGRMGLAPITRGESR
ncbi:MerR family transcriptional regulator [Actinophytocola sp.]|jgi:DNA-binding transcriptional MerR regulator|uniref:MerR family transcriptional regulator n=1 Tax=Actinophytocola sp. TaxID=1872138 RepID=UPI002EDAF761